MSFFSIAAFAQNFEDKGFKKENLFAGGSISVGFSNNSFQLGGNPMIGYSLAPWVDAGVVLNYNYASFRDWYIYDDKMRQSTYGGGVFTRLFPVRFLFAHAQIEQNFTRLKYIPGDGSNNSTATVDGSSLLLGAGYTSNRWPGSGQPYFYMSLLFDVLGNEASPYIDARGRAIPIVRAGLQVPLFQGRGR